MAATAWAALGLARGRHQATHGPLTLPFCLLREALAG